MIDQKVTDMTRARVFTAVATSILALAACNSEKADQPATEAVDVDTTAPAVDFKSADDDLGGATVTPGAPYRVSYRIVGTPVVGSPVAVELVIESLRGSRPVDLAYRINEESAMVFGDSQPAAVRLEPAANEAEFNQQVIVIPQREGRYYLNVSASFETDNGTMSTITAIPIQVGSGTRELEQNGEVEVDESGEAVRVLSDDGS